MFNNKWRIKDINVEQLTGSKLMIQPIYSFILQVCERIMPCGSRQFVFTQHSLLFPGICQISRVGGNNTINPIPPLDRLPAISPGRYPFRIDNLPLDMKTGDQKSVPLVFEVVKYGACVLPHQYRM